MALTMRPTGLGHGVYKDNIDYNIFSGEWNIGPIYETRGGRTFCQTVVFRRHSTNGPN